MHNDISGFACISTARPPVRKRFDAILLLGTATVALLASPVAFANPVGGAVTSGSATVNHPSSSETTVKQSSEGVVIDWSSFNVGAGQTTQFVQPNASAIAVNRIGSASASHILGTLDANGRILLINGNGLIIGKGAQIDVGSLIATSTDGSDSDLLSGKFTQAGEKNASVINNGAITAASGGVVALVAPNVTNAGTVNAKLGTVALGAANEFTVDFSGDGLVSFAAQGDVNARASAMNSGTLSGANVSMTAHAANGIATGVVDMSGIITAQGVQNVGGTIYLDAGNGTLTTTGTLNAAGATGGGSIETSGQTANISGHITAGQGGHWKVDPEDLTIDSNAATTIDGALKAGTSVLEQTTSGPASGSGTQTAGAGDITVASALSWSTSATLTLDAYHSLNIDAPISISGAGGLVLQYNDEATDGGLSFDLGSTGFVGNVSYGPTNNGGTLAINGANYTLVYSMSDLQAVNSNLNGNYALANSLDATGTSNFVPLGTFSNAFAGTFEGLGNTISNLTIDGASLSDVGLFGQSSGTIRDLGLAGESVTSSGTGGIDIGGLVGDNYGTVLNVVGSVAVGDSQYASIGGLIGSNEAGAMVVDAGVSGSVIDGAEGSAVGGLIGPNAGTVQSAYATASVNGVSSFVGGLVAYNAGTIENSYASGAAAGTGFSYVGGLVGLNQTTIENSYASGAATGGDNSYVGGLVGLNETTIENSYASGAATGGEGSSVGGLVGVNQSSLQYSFATGAASGGASSSVGGLAGVNQGAIVAAYATGAVSDSGSGAFAGGLVGYNFGTIDQTYAVGLVSGATRPHTGGLVGVDESTPGSITNSYWNIETSGITPLSRGAGNVANDSGITGEETAKLQQALPNGFDDTIWAIVPGLSYPYLQWQLPAGTPQVVTGILSNGATPISGAGVGLLIDGDAAATPLLSMSSGANGYYYLLLAPGTIPSSDGQVLGYIASGAARPGNTYYQDASGSLTNLDIRDGEIEIAGDSANASGTIAGLDTAIGSETGSQFIYTQAGGFLSGFDVAIDDTAASFTIDTTLNFTGDDVAINSAGTIGEASGDGIDAAILTGRSVGGANLNGVNLIGVLRGFTNDGAGGLVLTDNEKLVVTGAVNAGTGDLVLTMTMPGTGSDIAINGDITAGGTVTLTSAGSIWEDMANGVITATELTGSASGGTRLEGANLIGSLGDFTNTNGNFLLTNHQALTVSGTVNAGTNVLTLQTTSGDLVVDGALDAGTMTLGSSQGEVYGTGDITTHVLNVTADSGIALTGPNEIYRIGTNSPGTGPDTINQ